jgi:hypothetical protein
MILSRVGRAVARGFEALLVCITTAYTECPAASLDRHPMAA